MTLRQAFVDDIIQNPEDDCRRLIFADWLQDNNEEQLATFIRAQCSGVPGQYIKKYLENDGLKECCHLHPQARNWRVFTEQNIPNQLYGVPPHVLFTFERGFISTVECPLATWCEIGSGVTHLHPVSEVKIRDRYPQLDPAGHMFYWFQNLPDTERMTGYAGIGHFWHYLPGTISMNGQYVNSGYANIEDARQALSDACIAWARLPF